MKEIYEPKEGEWIYWRKKGFRFHCCECGVVHTLNLKIVKRGRRNYIKVQAFLK